MQQRPGMFQQGGPMPQGVPPNAMMGARGPPAQGFSPMRHAGPMVPNQSTPGKRPADNRNPPPMVKGYVLKIINLN